MVCNGYILDIGLGIGVGIEMNWHLVARVGLGIGGIECTYLVWDQQHESIK